MMKKDCFSADAAADLVRSGLAAGIVQVRH
jgi:hypothetical protein